MSDDKIIRMVDKTGSAMNVSPEDILREALSDLEPGGLWDGHRKMVILSLDHEGKNYTISSLAAGMSAHEIITLLKATKSSILRGMGY